MPDLTVTNKPESAALAEFLKEQLRPEQLLPGRGDVLITPRGFEVKSLKPFLDEYLDAPERKRGVAELHDLASLIDHVNRHKDANSVLFGDADAEHPRLIAVYDYNEQGPEGQPRFGQHRAAYRFPISEQWKAWTGKDGEDMSQVEFAAFLEEHLLDVFPVPLTPDGKLDLSVLSEANAEIVTSLGGKVADRGRLQTLANGLEIRANETAANIVNLSSGEARIQYSQEHTTKDGGPLDIPRLFVIAVPVFKLGDLYQLIVRLRYRLAGGKIAWRCELFRADEVFDHAIRKACEQAKNETQLPLFFGTPET